MPGNQTCLLLTFQAHSFVEDSSEEILGADLVSEAPTVAMLLPCCQHGHPSPLEWCCAHMQQELVRGSLFGARLGSRVCWVDRPGLLGRSADFVTLRYASWRDVRKTPKSWRPHQSSLLIDPGQVG